jgi:hypothetical protein
MMISYRSIQKAVCFQCIALNFQATKFSMAAGGIPLATFTLNQLGKLAPYGGRPL